MKEPKDGDLYFFIDETGDSTFYSSRGKKLIVGTKGCSDRLMMGFARFDNDPGYVREQIVQLRRIVLHAPSFQKYRSIAERRPAFHAADDPVEVREMFFELLSRINFRAEFVVSQKNERVFRERYEANTDKYYDDLVSRLVRNSLHRYTRNYVCIAHRGSRIRQQPLEDAVNLARRQFQEWTGIDPQTEVSVDVQSPNGEPCLSVVDYVGWALQRAYTTGDMSYYKQIERKMSVICELRAEEKPIYYHAKNRFKTS
jgi:hypothetical protein